MQTAHKLNPRILKEYDIRGIMEETLHEEDAFYIGAAFASHVKNSGHDGSIAVAWDGRLSSPALEKKLTAGMLSAGANVIRLGCGPTPMLYFAVVTMKLAGGVMITGSHNPKNHNGFKFMVGRKSIYGEEIKLLGTLIEEKKLHAGSGKVSDIDVKEDYVNELLKAFEKKPNSRNLKVAWDSGNGAAGEIMQRLAAKLPGQHIFLNAAIDGNFPSHHPDPSDEKNLQQLLETVKKEACDIGLAFDGDGDRVGAVTKDGRIITGDQMLYLYAEEVLENNPGATIIADIKTSKYVFDFIREKGGNPIIWKAGHSLIKAKMAETGAVFAGEMSGHIFFHDRYFGYDDGLYAAARLLNIAANSKETLEQKLDAFPKLYNTPEIRFFCADDKKFIVIENIKNRLSSQGEKFLAIDGIRVETAESWWLVRASNTQEALIARCEAVDESSLKKMKSELEKNLELENIEIDYSGSSH